MADAWEMIDGYSHMPDIALKEDLVKIEDPALIDVLNWDSDSTKNMDRVVMTLSFFMDIEILPL